MYRLKSIIPSILIFLLTFAGGEKKDPKEIKWLTFQEAVELNKKNPKKIYVDMYTSWCGWCKVMDAQTFKDPKVIETMNKHFYAVKMNAEMQDSIVFSNTLFINPNSNGNRSTHQLAAAMLDNKLMYPSSVFFDQGFNRIQILQGFLKPDEFNEILRFLGEDVYKTKSWEDFKAGK